MARDLMAQSGISGGGSPPPLPGAPATPAAALPTVELLDPASVAKALGVTEADVMAEIESGRLASKKIGSSYRITRAALDAFLAE
jgi:excisionase family DNA binding protein